MLVPAFALLALLTPASPGHQEELTLVRGVTVIDVEGGVALPDRTVRIRGERIEAVLSGPVQVPKEARVIEGKGLYLLPGLVDAHVHYGSAPDAYGPLLVANGVTLVRDTGSDTHSILKLRDELARGERVGPELVCTGAIVDGDPPVWPFSRACDTPEEVRTAVRELHAAGVDQIKVYSRLEPEVYAAAVDEAHALGLKAIGHVPDGLSILDALAAGQDGVEHLSGFEYLIAENAPSVQLPAEGGEWKTFAYWFQYPLADRSALRAAFAEIAAKGMVQCPTLVVMAGIAQAADASLRDERMLALVPAYMKAFWQSGQYDGFGRWTKKALPHMQSLVGELHRAGVKLMTGTDLANPYVYAGYSVHEEMRLFQEAGIAPADVLRAATIVPVTFLGLEQRLGSIAEGKSASLLLVRKDPLLDVRHASEIEGVFLRGRYFDRAALDGLLGGVRDALSGGRNTVAAAEPAEAPLAGELVAEGRLKITFMNFDAGHEEFRITRTGDGFAFRATSRPQGSPEPPFVLDAAYDPARSFRSAVYRELVTNPIEASYRIEGSKLHASAQREQETLEPRSLELATGALPDPPVFSAGFFTLAGLELAPGESRELTSIAFGRPDWRPEATPLKVERRADGELELDDGDTVTARIYHATYSTPMGEMQLDAWTDEAGVVLRAELSFPMGKIEAVLE